MKKNKWVKKIKPYGIIWTNTINTIVLMKHKKGDKTKYTIMHDKGLNPSPFDTKQQALNYVKQMVKECK